MVKKMLNMVYKRDKADILYLGGFNLPDKNAAAQRVVANSKIFRELGYNVQLVGLTKDNEGLMPFEYEGFTCVNLPYPRSITDWWKMLTSIKQYFPYYQEETAIVIAYNHPAIVLRKLHLHNLKRGIVTLSDCTEWYEPQGGWLFNIIKGWDVDHRMYKVQSKLDGIITISRFLDDFYKEYNVKTLLLPPLVDKKEAKWNGPIEQSTDIIKLLYAGSPGGTKDRLDWIINALDIVRKEQNISFTFDVVGITEQQYREVYLIDMQQDIPTFVSFHGRIAHEEVIDMLRISDFQIFLREDHLANRAGFPTKFTETISAGTIALTNASSNLRDYMVEGSNSFELDISSQESLIRTLKKPLSLGKRELARIQAQMDTSVFDYRNFIDKTNLFLQNL